jgi:hypothetical protein
MTPVHQLAPLQAFHMPATVTPSAVRTVPYGPVAVELPDESAPFYLALTERLRSAHASLMPQLTDEQTITLLAEAAKRWRRPDFSARRLALSILPAVTGYAPRMIEEGLDHRLAQLTPERLARLIDDADTRLARQERIRQGPPVALVVVAGHIPGLAIDEVIGLLLARSAGLIRPSIRDPIIPGLFVRTLAEIDPRIGELLAVAWWPREAGAITAAVGAAVDVVVASGDDDTIAELSRHAARMIGDGHRRSVALIGAEALADAGALAAGLARDVCWYEQQGCLSPHLVYVEEGGPIAPRLFAERMASALGRQAHQWPPAALPIEAASAILQLRADVEFRATTGADFFTPSPSINTLAGGTVLYDPDPAPRPSPGYRTLWVKPTATLDTALEALTPWRGRIESIGAALSDERLVALRPLIDRLGASRLTSIGMMQEPPLRWRLLDQGLLFKLATWIETPSTGRF